MGQRRVVAGLLAMWEVHELGRVFRRVWEAGVVLSGVWRGRSAGMRGARPTRSAPSCGRSPTRWRCSPTATACTTTPSRGAGRWSTGSSRRGPAWTHCTDDGVGLVYRGTELVEAVTEQDGKGAFIVSRDGDDRRRGADRAARRLPRPVARPGAASVLAARQRSSAAQIRLPMSWLSAGNQERPHEEGVEQHAERHDEGDLSQEENRNDPQRREGRRQHHAGDGDHATGHGPARPGPLGGSLAPPPPPALSSSGRSSSRSPGPPGTRTRRAASTGRIRGSRTRG